MDALLDTLSSVSLKLLPVLGVAIFVLLIIILRRSFDLMKKVEKTLDQVDATMKKIDGPLNTVVNVSRTIDSINSAAENAVKTLAVSAVKNYEIVLDWFKENVLKRKDKVKDNDQSSDSVEITEDELGL
ncbi:MAG: hypothetical protein FD133_1584 [Erysipelotrichaceae bacterium]|nr:MAG: hypothetical protein FD179_886 [Erysipelotrichaceae bacterium]TXT16991.1 MAG: hypothetical protein FD133_1584 [Erysipelotrichaceae bacterium]